jgi:hypothetical protein
MKKLTLIITILTAIGISSCKKGFLDESLNPNAPSSITLPLALSAAEKGAADIVNGWGSYTDNTWEYAPYAVWEGYWVESPNGYIQDPRLTEYQITTTTSGFPWSDLYDNLSNINLMQINATSQGNPDYEAIALILKAYDFEQLVDGWNNVPYSQAFQGSTGNLTPVYDSGASIYADLIKQMDNAISMISKNLAASAPVLGPGSDDIIFQGNMTSWEKFANTIKLRLIMRQSNLPIFPSLKTELASTETIGYLDGTTQAEAQPGYNLSDAYGGQETPFYLCYGFRPNGSTTTYGNSYWLANAFCVNLMQSLNDTSRVKRVYATTATDGTDYASDVIGAYDGTPNPPANVSHIGPGLLGDTETEGASLPAVMFSGAESLFLQAEAVNDGMLTGNATTLYDAAITASFEALGAQTTKTPAVVVNGVVTVPATLYNPDESAALYYAQPSVATPTEQNIITQKYIALNGYGNFEAYNEYRRTGFPAIPRSQNTNALGGTGQLPSIVFYPQIEYSTNPVNVGKQPAATIATEFNSKIFWAK